MGSAMPAPINLSISGLPPAAWRNLPRPETQRGAALAGQFLRRQGRISSSQPVRLRSHTAHATVNLKPIADGMAADLLKPYTNGMATPRDNFHD
jgi:hypothetical protein